MLCPANMLGVMLATRRATAGLLIKGLASGMAEFRKCVVNIYR